MAYHARRFKSLPAQARERTISGSETVASKLLRDPEGRTLYYNIVGPSMVPTLKPGDLLRVEPYRGSKLKLGDIAVFHPPHEKQLVTHRLVSMRDDRYVAQGDNNERADALAIPPESIIGRVSHVQRKLRFRRPASGRAGLAYGSIIRGVNGARRRLFYLGRPIYRWAAGRGLFRRLWPFGLPLKVISISRADGRELSLLLGGRVVGKLPPHQHRWWIRPPFRLLIDEQRLARTDHRH